MIEIKDLCKKFGDTPVLEGINVTIEDGDIYGLVGVSGAGKSTLLRCINGLLPFEEGSLIVDGIDIKTLRGKKLREFRSNVGMIFQQFSLLERMNVMDNVCLPMRCLKYNKKEMQKRALENLELVGMAERVKALPRELSGGQKQRVAIARAMALNPKILLCDEATSALDPNITQSILELLKEINRKSGITIVVVTHQMEVVKNICNKMTILSHGKLTISGEVKDIFLNHPETLQEVLGKSTEFPRKEGKIYLEIQQGIEGEKSTEYILSELAVQAGVNFNVVWGGMDRYRSSVAGNIVLEFPAEEKDKAQQYLDKRQIYWRAR
ncbi:MULTISPECIES: methionine ABC transporter ATP-binding protein [Eubacteriales]|uniref:methionine ABC transporter ATP-binding protein n=1 Tax=Eubacteriales TaxID=186802 RepID=UPI00051BA116|nr:MULTISPECIES: methionine ABC transporter ATP-binding protein [Eubacteriales]